MALWKKKKGPGLFIKYILAVIAVVLIIPALLSLLFPGPGKIRIEGDEVKVRLLLHETGQVVELGLEEYVVGVVAAEMPASFPLEALKAQAVAARTYAARRLQIADPRLKSNPQAHLSSDPAINQAWISDEEMKRRWGAWNYMTHRRKIVQAVTETKGKVLVYDGLLIDPAYHASCGGCGTENSEDVWKFKMPYLRRVGCADHPQGNKEAVSVFKLSEINRLFGTRLDVLPAGKIQVNSGVISYLEKLPSGRVKMLRIGDKNISGAELRSKLNLRSTYLEWRVENDIVKFITRGYGHGVGMCQYGAAALADSGKSYLQILQHYYHGVILASLATKQ